MGCVSGKPDINDIHPNIFEVTNVDERGHLISPGQLELTESELILHQRRKSPTRWPLRCVRKYGFDSDIFSFECGRRCHTGAGIYAFKCGKAEQLFNMVQQNIQLRNIGEENNVGVMYVNQGVNNNANGDFPVPLSSTGPPVQRRVPSQTPEGYLKPTPNSVTVRPHPSLSRPGSLSSSNDPASPLTPPILSPPPDVLPESNNNKQSNADNSYTNSSVIMELEKAALSMYSNIPNPNFQPNLPVESSSHLYMNVDTNEACSILQNDTKDMPNILATVTDLPDNVEALPKTSVDVEETRHCYANIGAAEWESLRISFNHTEVPPRSPDVPETPTYVTVREVNYAELDLVPCKSEHSTSSQVTPDSPDKTNKSYVTIDFKKTNALSQSVNPNVGIEEGSRKTRHNSTISDVARHSNSLSD